MFAAWKRTRRLRSYVRDDIVDFVAGFHQDYPELPLNFESIFDGVKAMQMLYRRENKIKQVELLFSYLSRVNTISIILECRSIFKEKI
jgi:hypothetical protein